VLILAAGKILAADEPSFLIKQRHFKLGHERLYINSHSLRLVPYEHEFFFVASAPDWHLYGVTQALKIYCDLDKLHRFRLVTIDKNQAKPSPPTLYKGILATRCLLKQRTPEEDLGFYGSKNGPPKMAVFPPHAEHQSVILSSELVREHLLHLPAGAYNAVNRLAHVPADQGLPIALTHSLKDGTTGVEFSYLGYEEVPASQVGFAIPKDYRLIADFNEFMRQSMRAETEGLFQDLRVGDPFGSAEPKAKAKH